MPPLPHHAPARHRAPRPQGFTLIEVVVTLGVFSIASLMAVNLFVIFIQQQRRTVNQQELQNDARAVVEQVANDLREGVLDYAYYTTHYAGAKTKLFTAVPASATECLVIRDAVNVQIRYRLNASVVERAEVADATQQGYACSDGNFTTPWGSITPSALTVESFTFFAAPSEDPFAGQLPQSCTTDAACRWGTLCYDPGSTKCQYKVDDACFCTPLKYSYLEDPKLDAFPLHPRVTISLHTSRAVGQQTIAQTFQTTIASRIFKNIEHLNQYAQ